MKLKRDGNIAKLFKKKMENKQRQVRGVDWLQCRLASVECMTECSDNFK